MKITCTLFFLLLLSVTADSQKLTGIWRGYFSQTPISREGVAEERYKYEIQIDQLVNNSLNGVTYSYKSTSFYGKAAIKGILTLPAKSLIIKETKLLELKVSGQSEPCLMTCYLEYVKMGKMEVLQGTFISENADSKTDCGSGTVYLERVPESDFDKEDFLVKRIDTAGIKITAKNKPPVRGNAGTNNAPQQRGNNAAVKPNTVHPPATQQKAQANPLKKNNTPLTKNIPKNNQSQKAKTTDPKLTAKKDDGKTTGATLSEKAIELPALSQKDVAGLDQISAPARTIPVPKVLRERENNLIKVINVNEPDILVELYDNGTIDNDTISVYHNNEKVISNGRLVYKPLVVKIRCSKEEPRHELVIVAENLGDIAPNTALMVVTTLNGKQRYEITLSSNEERNAKVIINYVPKNGN